MFDKKYKKAMKVIDEYIANTEYELYEVLNDHSFEHMNDQKLRDNTILMRSITISELSSTLRALHSCKNEIEEEVESKK